MRRSAATSNAVLNMSNPALQPTDDFLRELLRMKQLQVRRQPPKLFVLRVAGFSHRQDVPHIERRENVRLGFDGDVEEETVLGVDSKNESFWWRQDELCEGAILR